MADLFLIATTAIGAASAAHFWLKSKDLADRYTFQRLRGDGYRDQMLDLQARLAVHDQAEAKRQAQRTAAARKGTEASAAKARAKKAQDELERPMRAAKTIEALGQTKMRSRAAVVAPVKAARTRAQNNSGAGAAAR